MLGLRDESSERTAQVWLRVLRIAGPSAQKLVLTPFIFLAEVAGSHRCDLREASGLAWPTGTYEFRETVIAWHRNTNNGLFAEGRQQA